MSSPCSRPSFCHNPLSRHVSSVYADNAQTSIWLRANFRLDLSRTCLRASAISCWPLPSVPVTYPFSVNPLLVQVP
eukprot:6214321-Pleurochrysis_carterae.AAC.5